MDEVLAIVLNWNAHRSSERCAASVLASRGVETSLLIVDNASGDGSAARLAERFGEERVLALPENRGYAGGMNAALEWSRARSAAPFVLFLTQDVVLEPDALARMTRALRAEPSAGIAGPVVLFEGREREVFSAGGRLCPRRASTPHVVEVAARAPYAVEWVDGCCVLARREVLEEVGGFDERYFMYFEENDFCQRARGRGWSVLVVPDASVTQAKPRLPGPHYFYYMNRNRFLFWRERFGLGFFAVARSVLSDTFWTAAGLVRSVVVRDDGPATRDCVRRLWRQVRWSAAAMLDHLRGRYGYRPFDA